MTLTLWILLIYYLIGCGVSYNWAMEIVASNEDNDKRNSIWFTLIFTPVFAIFAFAILGDLVYRWYRSKTMEYDIEDKAIQYVKKSIKEKKEQEAKEKATEPPAGFTSSGFKPKTMDVTDPDGVKPQPLR